MSKPEYKEKKNHVYHPRYSNPITRKQLMANIVANLAEMEKMEDFKPFSIASEGLKLEKTSNIRWAFLEGLVDDLNKMVKKEWDTFMVPQLNKEIEEYKAKL